MAEAAGHKWGQFVGEYCEKAIEPFFQAFAKKHGLFLDKKGPRPARNKEEPKPAAKRKFSRPAKPKKPKNVLVKWLDSYGNQHSLDYVFERGGTPERIGTPVAFIESAWRRYTKHSRNKAQEIQGAILPIADRHHFCAPFLGCILVGDYTAESMTQLRSVGFKLLHLSYESMIEAFASVGIDARTDEDTPDSVHEARMAQWQALPTRKQTRVWANLIKLNQRDLDEFMLHLERAVVRQINTVRVIPLHGIGKECLSVAEAIAFVEKYDEHAASGPLLKYEVIIRYDNGDKVDAQFTDRASTIEFLAAFQGGNWTPAIDDLASAVEGASDA